MLQDLQEKQNVPIDGAAGRSRRDGGWEPRSTERPGRLAATQWGRHSAIRWRDGPEPPGYTVCPAIHCRLIHILESQYISESGGRIFDYSKSCQVRLWPNLTDEKINTTASMQPLIPGYPDITSPLGRKPRFAGLFPPS